MHEKIAERKKFTTLLLNHYLETDISGWEGVTHKKIGDNLRCYPIIAAFAVAILYLWDLPYVVFGYHTVISKIAAVIWGVWLIFFTLLTLFQTAWIFSNAYPDLLNLFGQVQKKTARRSRLVIGILMSIAAGFFMIGAIELAWLIFSHAAKL